MKRSIKTILALFLTIAMLAAFFVTGFATGDIKGDVNPDKPEIAGGIPSLPGHGNNTNQPEDGDFPADEDTDGRVVVIIPHHSVTVTAAPADGGTVNGAGTFEFGLLERQNRTALHRKFFGRNFIYLLPQRGRR